MPSAPLPLNSLLLPPSTVPAPTPRHCQLKVSETSSVVLSAHKAAIAPFTLALRHQLDPSDLVPNLESVCPFTADYRRCEPVPPRTKMLPNWPERSEKALGLAS
jgi:hypothetical protein